MIYYNYYFAKLYSLEDLDRIKKELKEELKAFWFCGRGIKREYPESTNETPTQSEVITSMSPKEDNVKDPRQLSCANKPSEPPDVIDISVLYAGTSIFHS